MPAKRKRRVESRSRGTGARDGRTSGSGGAKRAGPKSAKSARRAGTGKAGAQRDDHRVRLQRALAAAGFGSRRQCEELILEGRVEVDGEVVDRLGTTIDPTTAKLKVDGTAVKPKRLVYYAVNKPPGIVTTNADPQGRPRVIDLVPPKERVFPVGRLDRSSEGLILLTNDGELAQRLAHPRYEIPKVYRVTVAGNVLPETLQEMRRGIHIAEGLVRVEGARILKARPKATELEVTLKEGKNREIRRILARLGHKVQSLRRIAIGPLRLGEMPTGAYRRLTAEEVRKLWSSVESAESEQAELSAGNTTKAAGAAKPARSAKRDPDSPVRRKTAGKRPSAPGARRRDADKASASPLSLLSKTERTGAVIGSDPPTATPGKPRSVAKRAGAKRPAGRRTEPAGRRTEGKRPAKRKAGKRGGRK